MQPASAQTNPESGSSAQGEVRCSRCGRGNAADAKFCAGCGTVLTKAADATAEALDASLSADVFKPLPKRDPQFAFRVAVASGVLVMVVAGAGYYLYRNFLFVDFSPAFTRSMPPDASRMGVAPGPVDTGKVTPTPETSVPTPAPEANAPTPARQGEAAVSPPKSVTQPPAPLRPAPAERRAPRKTASESSAAIKPAAVSPASCTQAMAAVGLCQAASPEESRTPAAAASAHARGSAQGAASCEGGVAALGLCAAASNQGKE
jgi:hypothetical protein